MQEPSWGWYLFPERPPVADRFPCFAMMMPKRLFLQRPSTKAITEAAKRIAFTLRCTRVFVVTEDGGNVTAVMMNKEE